MEQRITSNSERAVTTLVNDVEHIESQSLNGTSIVKDFLPADGEHSDRAGANDRNRANHSASRCRPGRHRRWSRSIPASTVPVIQIGLTSDYAERAGAVRLTGTILYARSWPPCTARTSLPIRRQTTTDLCRYRFPGAAVKRSFAGGHRQCGERAEPDPADGHARSLARSSTRWK